MKDQIKISVSMAGFLSGGDWVCPSYRREYEFEEFLEDVAEIPGVSGIDMGFSSSLSPSEVVDRGELVWSYGLDIAMLMVNTWGGAQWKFGTFTAPDPAIRQETIRLHKLQLELAQALDVKVAGVWLAHDGFDYVLQVDYARHWGMLVDGFREVTAHRPDVNVAIEYKLKDPRNFCHLSNMSTCLLLSEEVGAPNLGILQDVGHSLIARENMAEAAVMAMRKGRLFHTHWNENYRSEDIDVMCGTVHLWETIECLYWLRKMGYEGWYGFDVISKREDSVRHISESVAAIRQLAEIAQSLDHDLIARAQAKQDAVTATEHLRQSALR